MKCIITKRHRIISKDWFFSRHWWTTNYCFLRWWRCCWNGIVDNKAEVLVQDEIGACSKNCSALSSQSDRSDVKRTFCHSNHPASHNHISSQRSHRTAPQHVSQIESSCSEAYARWHCKLKSRIVKETIKPFQLRQSAFEMLAQWTKEVIIITISIQSKYWLS